jgi:two-component system, OmpR family, phosphate regulon sensor histidine kinase PhoR
MQGAVREIALELVRADGRRVPVLVNATLRRSDAGRPELVRISVFDASDRRRYEQELLQARAAAEDRAAAATALAHVAEGVVLVDGDGAVRVINPAAERIFGVFAADALGLRLDAVVRGWTALAERIAPSSAPVVVPVSIAGSTRWLAVTAEVAPEGTVYTLRDVTQERRLDDFRDDIVAIVSHELRTPLAGIGGAARTLAALGDRLEDSERGELLDVVVSQTDRLTAIVEKMLLTQRLDAGEIAAERRMVDVGDVAGRAVAAFPSHAVRLQIEGEPVAEADAALLEQVIVNLLDNATKYGSPGAEVRVVVERARSHVRLAVVDSGPGVPAADRERIFEKFFRSDPDQASGVGGSGLGLYIARELVRRMRGRIRLEDCDGGSAFVVELPGAPG